MKFINTIKNILLGTFIVFSSFSIAQTSCNNSLYQANKLYESGKIQEAIDMLTPCANKSTMNKEELTESYKLLITAYGDLNDKKKRDEYVKSLLLLRPDYKNLPNSDSKQFNAAINSFQIIPQVLFGIKFGGNINSPKLVKSFSALEVNQAYENTLGYQIGIFANYQLLSKTQLEVNVASKGINIRHHMEEENVWSKDYAENIRAMHVSFGGNQFVSVTKHINAFGGLFVGFDRMTNSRMSVTTENLNYNQVVQKTSDGMKRNNIFQPVMGIKTGFAIELNRGFVYMNIGYSHYSNNTIDASKRGVDEKFLFETQYQNDDIKSRLIQFDIGLALPLIYKVSK